MGFIQFTTSSSRSSFSTFEGERARINSRIIISFVTYRISVRVSRSVAPCLFIMKMSRVLGSNYTFTYS